MIRKIQSNLLLRKLYFDKTEIEKLLILSCMFSVGLSIVRFMYTGEPLFLSLNWNLFLGFVPYVMTRWLMAHPAWIENTSKFVLVFMGWLLFIPNSFYIITDLFHLDQNKDVPLWFDLALILSFAWNGLLLGVLSVRQMEKMIEVKLFRNASELFVGVMMLLNAFGIYLGRYLRYNSWDVITNPTQLVKDMIYLVIHPLRNGNDWSMVFCYAILMWFMYQTLKKLSKAVW